MPFKKLRCFFKWTALTVAALAVVALAALGYLFLRALPDQGGKQALPGLRAEAHIWTDAYGVPHIFAANMNDAARALGYIHAGERMFQMEMQRRAGQGRLAEILGPDVLDVDIFTRTLGLYHLAQSSFDALSPEARDYFQAYADGVNAWLKTHQDRLPPEFLVLHDRPEPWTPADSLVWGKLMALQLSHNYKLEMLRANLARHLKPAEMQALFPAATMPVTTDPQKQDTADQAQNVPAADEKLASLLGLDHAASNEWVMAGALTASGKPILANDPHLGLEAPILWYLARIVTPELNVKGATVPGLPVVLLGQNAHIAWGFTTTGSDVEDLFVETLDPQNADQYLTPDGPQPFAKRQETIHVKGQTDKILTVRSTRHGPVMSDINADMQDLAGSGKVMALAFTGLGAADRTSESLLHLNRAANWDEFQDALKLYEAPPQNLVYADDQGHIGYINPGLLPIRKQGDGLLPADGASGDNDWIGMATFDQMPHLYDPPANFIFNANNEVKGADPGLYLGRDWEEPYRARRLQQFFDRDGKRTLDDVAAMQADHLSLVAKDLLPRLLHVPPLDGRMKTALDMLRGWDGVMDKDKPAPLIFEAWLYHMHKLILTDKAHDPLREKGPFAAATMADMMTRHPLDWCGDPSCMVITVKALADALDMLESRQGADMSQWRWGRENIATLRHKFYSHIPLLSWLSDLSRPSSGDFYTLDRGGGFDNDADHPFARTHGGGFRGIYDLGDPDASRFVIATGQSGHIVSRHYGDLAPLWNDVRSITLSGSEDDLRRQGRTELILYPVQ